jgi:N-methylhydantoinase A
VIDLVEIGAGGGSIAWVDSGGALRVGPQSAGAEPGPACYGRGGVEPTITDANLVLGRLAADNFLGGQVQLDVDAAWRAVERRCAQPLGLGVVTAAHGIIEIANAAMTNALHLVSVQRGHDPRDFALIAFGGAGPLHANRLAEELHIPLTVIPSGPGITSALGLLATDLVHDYSRTLHRPMLGLDMQEVEDAFQTMEEDGRRVLERDGVQPRDVAFRRYMEMRYAGQSFELTIPVLEAALRDGQLRATVEAFHHEHERAYGFAAPEEPTEVVTLRVSAIGRMPRPRLHPAARAIREVGPTRVRRVYFEEAGDFVSCSIYDRYTLGVGVHVDGPAIIEELDSTSVVHPGYSVAVDEFGNLHLTPGTQ